MARNDGRTLVRDIPTKPGVTYPQDSLAHPQIVELRSAGQTETKKVMLTAHWDTTKYPNAYLVDLSSSKGDNSDANWTEVYKTLPGPWIVTTRKLMKGALVLSPSSDTRIFFERKERDVLPATYPAGSATISGDTVSQQTATLAREIQEGYVDHTGAAVTQPLFTRLEWDDDKWVWHAFYQQLQPAPVTKPVIGDTYGSNDKLVGNSIDTVTVTSAGSSYTTQATATVPKTSGVRAVLSTLMKATAIVSVVARGTGYTNLSALTATGGTGTASVLTPATLEIASLTSTQSDDSYQGGNVLTLVGGTHSVAGTVTVVSVMLHNAVISAGGAGYTVGDTLTAIGGTFTSAATVEVTTVAAGVVTGFTIDDPGIYTIGSGSLTFSGGSGTGFTVNATVFQIQNFTISNRGSYTVTTGTLTATGGSGAGASFDALFGIKTATITTPGSYSVLPPQALTAIATITNSANYSPGDKVTLAGGTGTAAVLQVITISQSNGFGQGPIATISVFSAGAYNTVPASFTAASSTGSTSLGAVTVVAATDLFTCAGHGRSAGDIVRFISTGTLPGGTIDTRFYYVIASGLTSDDFKVSLTLGGSTIDVTSIGTGTHTLFTPSAAAGQGAGGTFSSASYSVTVPVTGGTGTGATFSLTYAVNSIAVVTAGTMYFGTIPVTVSGNATATAALTSTAGTISATGYIIDASVEEQQGSNLLLVKWQTMPIPPTKVRQIDVGVLFHGYATIPQDGRFQHNPPWPGFEWTPVNRIAGSFPGKLTMTFQIGPPTLPQTYTVTTPASVSKLFPIPNKTIVNAYTASLVDGTYAEQFPASTTTGWDEATRIAIVKAYEEQIAGTIYAKCIVEASPDGPIS